MRISLKLTTGRVPELIICKHSRSPTGRRAASKRDRPRKTRLRFATPGCQVGVMATADNHGLKSLDASPMTAFSP